MFEWDEWRRDPIRANLFDGRLTDADYSRAILKSCGKPNRQQHLQKENIDKFAELLTVLWMFSQELGCLHHI